MSENDITLIQEMYASLSKENKSAIFTILKALAVKDMVKDIAKTVEQTFDTIKLEDIKIATLEEEKELETKDLEDSALEDKEPKEDTGNTLVDGSLVIENYTDSVKLTDREKELDDDAFMDEVVKNARKSKQRLEMEAAAKEICDVASQIIAEADAEQNNENQTKDTKSAEDGPLFSRDGKYFAPCAIKYYLEKYGVMDYVNINKIEDKRAKLDIIDNIKDKVKEIKAKHSSKELKERFNTDETLKKYKYNDALIKMAVIELGYLNG